MRRAAGIVLAGVLLTLAGLAFNAAPLFVPGIGFALAGIAAPAWVWLSAFGTSVERHLSARRVVEDEPLEATIVVRGGRLLAPSATVHDPLLSTPVAVRARGGGTSVHVILRFPRRGMLRLAQPELVLSDPLELAHRRSTASGPEQELLVLPRTEPIRWADGARAATSTLLGTTASTAAGAAVDIDGLRPYTEGTPASRIHWSALARGAGLLERRLRDEGDTRPLIVLDARGAARPEDLDAAVRAAASLALELARASGSGLLLPGDRRPMAIHPDLIMWPSAHARLALVEDRPGAPAPALKGVGPRRAPLIYVAARRLDSLPPAARSIARGLSVLVTPADRATERGEAGSHRRPAFEVSGCHGWVLRVRPQARVAAG
jgi:uncharacterized protein (DUF58 family)